MNDILKSYPDMLTTTQLQTVLNISKTKTYKLLRNGIIRSIKLGYDYRIPKMWLVDYLQTSCYNGGETNLTPVADNRKECS